MTLTLQEIVMDFATAFKEVDVTGPQGRSRQRVYRPGIGPLSEADAIRLGLAFLAETSNRSDYASASPLAYPGSRQKCDLVFPDSWAIEFKLIRPFGDNGIEAEHWSENILHPYEGNTSAIGDCLKLIDSNFSERKAIIVFGYEHTPPRIELEIAVQSFEIITSKILGISLSKRINAKFDGLIHPVHQQGRVYGWEIL